MQYFIVYIAEKDKYHITYNRNLKKKRNDTSVVESQTLKTNLRLPKGKVREGMN